MKSNLRSVSGAAVLLGAGLCASALLTGAVPALAGIEAEPAFPTEGKPAMVVVTDDQGNPVRGVEVIAVYRPGSRVAKTENLGPTRTDGSLSWSPTAAGLVTLSTSGDGGAAMSRNLSVKYQGLPVPGLVILILAGVILYGGVILGFQALKAPPPILPPDT